MELKILQKLVHRGKSVEVHVQVFDVSFSVKMSLSWVGTRLV